MPAADITSAVFILRPETHFAPRAFLGRMAHRLFLLMLNQSGYAQLAQSLHDHNGALPYTVSDLFTNGPAHFWLRVTGLTPTLSAVLHDLCQKITHETVSVPPRERKETTWTFTVEAALLSQHEWASSLTYVDFIRDRFSLPKHRQITLEFVTPTLLQSVGVQRPFPQPGLIFRLLYERLLKGRGFPLLFQPEPGFVDAFADYFLEISDYQIDCIAKLPLKNAAESTFRGWITYHGLNSNEDFYKRAATLQKTTGDAGLIATQLHIEQHLDAYMRLIHLLSQFAFYSGIGKYTGQGMGMVRVIEHFQMKQNRRR